MARKFGPGNWPPQPTSAASDEEAFNAKKFLRGIEQQYLELGQKYQEVVGPETWEAANAAFEKIKALSGEYESASNPKQKERISASMQRLGVSFGGRISKEIADKAEMTALLAEKGLSDEFEVVKPEEKKPAPKGLEALFAAVGDVDPEENLALRASKGTVRGKAKKASAAPTQEQQDAAYQQSKRDAEERARNTAPEDQTVRGKTLDELKEESISPKEKLSDERQKRKLTKAILAHISGESAEAIGNIFAATDVDVSNEERQELMALLADPATRDRAAGLLETVALSPKKTLEYGNQFAGLINEAVQSKTPEATGKEEEAKLREAQEKAAIDTNIAQRAAAEQAERAAAEAEKLAAVQSKLGMDKPAAPTKPAEVPASVPVMQPFTKTPAGSYDPEYVPPSSRAAMYKERAKEERERAAAAKPNEKPLEAPAAPAAPAAPEVDASEMQAPQYGREKVLRNMQKDIDGLAREAETPASVRPSNEPYAVFRSNRKPKEEASTAEPAAPAAAVEAPPAAAAPAEVAHTAPADDTRPAGDFFSRQVLGDAFVDEQQKAAAASQSAEEKPKGVSMSDLAGNYNPQQAQENLYQRYIKGQQPETEAKGVSMADLAGNYDAKKSQEELYQRYTEGQQAETKPKASPEGGPLDPYRKKFASMRDAFLRFSNKYPGIAQMPEDVVNRFYELNDRMKKSLESENVDMDALESAAIDADALTARLTEQNKDESALGKIVPNPEDAIDPEHAREMAGKKEGTRSEWTKRLREAVGKLVGGVKEKAAKVSEGYTKSKELLNNRAKEMDAKAEKMGGVEKWFRGLGEAYNKRSFREKLGIGVTLGLGAAVFATSWPAALAFTGLLGVQRAFGMASMFLKIEKDLQQKKVGEESNQFIGRKERAFLDSALYTFAVGAAITKGLELASEYDVVGKTRMWLGDMFDKLTGRDAVSEGIRAASPVRAPSTMPAEAMAPNRVEVPLILERATPGQGYEYMAKRMWEQLKMENLNPDNYDKKSDIYKLLTADEKSINDAVHEIAGKHAFYKPDGTSFRIDLGSSMTINAEGNLQVDDIVNAPPTPVTPVYPPVEAAAAYRAPLGPNDMPQGVASPDVVPTAPQGAPPPPSGVEPSPVASPVQPGAEQPLVWRDSSGNVIRDGSGNPINSESYEQPAPAARVETPAPAAESAQVPMVEHLKEFINKNNVPVDPLRGGVFADSSGAALAYGNDFAARLNAAQVFAKANPDTSVWVQAEKPALVDGVLRTYVFEVKYTGLVFKSMQIISPDAPVDAAHIGAIDPDSFMKQLDK